MQIQAITTINEQLLSMSLPNQQGVIAITTKDHTNCLSVTLTPVVYLLFNKTKLIDVQVNVQADLTSKKTITKIVQIEPAAGVTSHQVAAYFTQVMTGTVEKTKKGNQYFQLLQLTLHQLGLAIPINNEQKNSSGGKAQHRWKKAISEIPFHLNFRDCQATCYWQKRNEMLIKKGATMLAKAPLNKDGSVGISARMGEQLRNENAAKFTGYVTTEDIVLRSVNEVGLFLYFAGTNSWLQLVNDQGQTLDELTRVD